MGISRIKHPFWGTPIYGKPQILYAYMYIIYIYIYMCVCVFVCMYTYIYIYMCVCIDPLWGVANILSGPAWLSRTTDIDIYIYR